MMLNTVAKKFHVDGFNNTINRLILPTKDSIKTDGLFTVNNSNIQVILNNPNLALDDYRAPGQMKYHKKNYIESLVKFDQKTYPNKTTVKGNSFLINTIPRNVKKVQTPITYLKGFVAFNESGEKLSLYKDTEGFISVTPHGAKMIRLEYHKTWVHQVSILIFMLSWAILGGYWIFNIWKGNIYENTLDNRTSL
ncbi:hypothetical protein [Leuconostoc citreum]|nr:hypothetical protein [Leuconostoc citreum]CCF27394.1 Protein of unknown function [Leuconostoc citreum LBAE C11]